MNTQPTLPRRVTTKAQAIDLAATLFPDYKDLAATVAADPHYVHRPDCVPYAVQWPAHAALYKLLDWLTDPDTRLYKRARFTLYQHAARRFYAIAEDARTQAERNCRDTQFLRRLAATIAADTAADGSHI